MDNKTSGIGGTIVWSILWFCLGYFQYGGIDGGLACVIYSWILGVTVLIAAIPFIGVFAQYMVNNTYVSPFLLNFTHITESWVTTVIFSISIIAGAIVTIGMTIAIFVWWRGGR